VTRLSAINGVGVMWDVLMGWLMRVRDNVAIKFVISHKIETWPAVIMHRGRRAPQQGSSIIEMRRHGIN
jgi:hypothetical protein